MTRSYAAACLALALLAGCGGSTEDDPTITAPSDSPSIATSRPAESSPPPPQGTTLRAGDFSFSPRVVTIRKGEVLTLRNTGRNAHTWTSAPGQGLVFDIALSDPGVTAHYSASRVGSFDFVCTIHEGRGMTGTLVVTA